VSPRCRTRLGPADLLDGFESQEGWKIITAEGVTLSVHPDEGVNGHSLRLDYDFVTGAGYCLIQKAFPLKLPPKLRVVLPTPRQGPAQ